jgi:outer membrane protein OmpA-like peptidoglycan-associated protein
VSCKLMATDKRSAFLSLISISIACLFLSACASSDVSRNVAANTDMGVQNAKNLVDDGGNSDIMESYRNTSQRTKGALLGAAAGAITATTLVSGMSVLPATATGAVLGASYGAYIDAHTTLEDRLINRGVNTVVLGDQVLIVLNSSNIFEYQTARIKPQAYSTLKMVSQYINQYPNMMVRVSGYTADTGSKRVDLALSTMQAQSVARTLSANGVNTRIMYAMGYGGSQLVTANTLDWDDNDNYRVEITLEKLYV